MKIKLSKFGDAAIIQQDNNTQFIDETISNLKEKIVEDDNMKRTESSIGMKIKLSKSGDASVINNESVELVKEELEQRDKVEDSSKRIDSSIGVKIKLAKMKDGGASIVTNESIEEIMEKIESVESSKKNKFKKREISETIETEESIETDSLKLQELCKTKIPKIISSENKIVSTFDQLEETKTIGMKIKLSKSTSIMHIKNEELFSGTESKINDQPISMKIKLSKSNDSAIVQTETFKEADDLLYCIKTKHSKNKDHK
jgi:hypothetical protein